MGKDNSLQELIEVVSVQVETAFEQLGTRAKEIQSAVSQQETLLTQKVISEAQYRAFIKETLPEITANAIKAFYQDIAPLSSTFQQVPSEYTSLIDDNLFDIRRGVFTTLQDARAPKGAIGKTMEECEQRYQLSTMPKVLSDITAIQLEGRLTDIMKGVARISEPSESQIKLLGSSLIGTSVALNATGSIDTISLEFNRTFKDKYKTENPSLSQVAKDHAVKKQTLASIQRSAEENVSRLSNLPASIERLGKKIIETMTGEEGIPTALVPVVEAFNQGVSTGVADAVKTINEGATKAEQKYQQYLENTVPGEMKDIVVGASNGNKKYQLLIEADALALGIQELNNVLKKQQQKEMAGQLSDAVQRTNAALGRLLEAVDKAAEPVALDSQLPAPSSSSAATHIVPQEPAHQVEESGHKLSQHASQKPVDDHTTIYSANVSKAREFWAQKVKAEEKSTPKVPGKS